MAIHDRAYHRSKSWSKALRKYHIDRDRTADHGWGLWYNNLHQYADNKIHCPMCSAKTNNKNRSGARRWEPSENWSITDKRKLDSLASQITDLDN